jgi:hypothetical protein
MSGLGPTAQGSPHDRGVPVGQSILSLLLVFRFDLGLLLLHRRGCMGTRTELTRADKGKENVGELSLRGERDQE